jgi:hypothetical protein
MSGSKYLGNISSLLQTPAKALAMLSKKPIAALNADFTSEASDR